MGYGCEVEAVGWGSTCTDPSSSVSSIISSSGEECSRYCKPACCVHMDWLQLAWPLRSSRMAAVMCCQMWADRSCHEDAQDCRGGKQKWTTGLRSPIASWDISSDRRMESSWSSLVFTFVQPPFVIQLLRFSSAGASLCVQLAARSLLVRKVWRSDSQLNVFRNRSVEAEPGSLRIDSLVP